MKDYEAANGGAQPDGLSALGFDAAKVLGAALLRTAGLQADRALPFSEQNLRDQIAATKDFPGITGTITINAERNAVKPATVLKVEGGHLKQVAKIEPY